MIRRSYKGDTCLDYLTAKQPLTQLCTCSTSLFVLSRRHANMSRAEKQSLVALPRRTVHKNLEDSGELADLSLPGTFSRRTALKSLGGLILMLSGVSCASSSSPPTSIPRSEEHTSELQSHVNLVC